MIYNVQNPKGLDAMIYRLQQHLHRKLLAEWEIDTGNYDCFPRCYRNTKDRGFIPEFFIGGKDYMDVYGNDKVAVQSFFGKAEKGPIERDGTWIANVHLVFHADISRITKYAGYAHRADAEVIADVWDMVKSKGFTLTDWVEGIDNVFAEYPGKRRELIANRNMHPYLYFRFNMTCRYNPKDCQLAPISDVIGK